jgi:DNA-binding CsgD family transcriptional regulator
MTIHGDTTALDRLDRKSKLSAREEQILSMAMEGYTDKLIAHKLQISVATVKSYWVRIRQKVGGFSRVETVAKKIRRDHVPGRSQSMLPISEWWSTLCRHAPWTLIMLDAKGMVEFVAREPAAGISEYMLGRHLLDLCAPIGRGLLSMKLDEVIVNRVIHEISLPFTLSASYVAELGGTLAPVEGGGAILFVETMRRIQPRRMV